jgi:DNA-binding NtrC family response regulator
MNSELGPRNPMAVATSDAGDRHSSERPTSLAADSGIAPPGLELRRLRADAEISAISQALERTGWNRRRAAELLRISYRGLLYKIRQYDITSASASQLSSLPENAKAE